MRVFVALFSYLEFHIFPSACQVPLANPILLSTSLSVPFCVLMIPPIDTQSSPFAPIPVLLPPGKTSCFPPPKIDILSSVCLSLCPFFGSPLRLLSASSVGLIPFPVRRVERCHPQISNLLSLHLRCQLLRLIHPVPLP